jgi:hypothetical protein
MRNGNNILFRAEHAINDAVWKSPHHCKSMHFVVARKQLRIFGYAMQQLLNFVFESISGALAALPVPSNCLRKFCCCLGVKTGLSHQFVPAPDA